MRQNSRTVLVYPDLGNRVKDLNGLPHYLRPDTVAREHRDLFRREGWRAGMNTSALAQSQLPHGDDSSDHTSRSFGVVVLLQTCTYSGIE